MRRSASPTSREREGAASPSSMSRRTMVDLHSHILHGLDDGPVDLAGSLALARAVIADGTHVLVATPHVSIRYPTLIEARDTRAGEARAAFLDSDIDLEVVTGAEIDLASARRLGDDELSALALGSGPWLLLEMPHTVFPFGLGELIADLGRRGHRVVLAHPERSPHVQDSDRLVEEAVALGAVVQVTCASLLGRLGRGTHAAAWRLAERGLVHVVASDAHGAERRRPAMSAAREAIRHRLGDEHARALVERVPAALLVGAAQAEILEILRDASAPRRGRARGWARRR